MQIFKQKSGSPSEREMESRATTKFFGMCFSYLCVEFSCTNQMIFYTFIYKLQRIFDAFDLLACHFCCVHWLPHAFFISRWPTSIRWNPLAHTIFVGEFLCSNHCMAFLSVSVFQWMQTSNRLPTTFCSIRPLPHRKTIQTFRWFFFFASRYVGKPIMLNFSVESCALAPSVKGKKETQSATEFIFFFQRPNFVALLHFL